MFVTAGLNNLLLRIFECHYVAFSLVSVCLIAAFGRLLPSPADGKRVSVYETCVFLKPSPDLMQPDGISVTFLPLDSLYKLPEKQKYSRFFNTIYFSAR